MGLKGWSETRKLDHGNAPGILLSQVTLPQQARVGYSGGWEAVGAAGGAHSCISVDL